MDDKKFVEWLKNRIIIGYSKNPQFKPIVGQVAVLIEEDNWQAWSHVPDRIWEKYIDSQKE